MPRTEQGPRADVPLNLNDVVIQALLSAAAQEPVVPGFGLPDGTFRIPGVPSGSVWIRVGGSYYWTDQQELNLDQVSPGRGDVVYGGNDTFLGWNVTGLTPWTNGDFLEFNAPNLGAAYIVNGLFQNPLVEGPTGLTQMAMYWSGMPLLEEAKGDRGMFLQSGPISLETGETITGVKRMLQLGSTSWVSGAVNPIQGSFTAPPLERFQIGWKRSAFEAQASATGTGAFPANQSLIVLAHPFGVADGWVGSGANVLRRRREDSNPVDLPPAMVEAGQPYPAAWLFSQIDHTGWVPINGFAPGGRMYVTTARLGNVAAGTPAPALTDGPLLSPLRNVELQGLSAGTPMTDVGFTPRISWTDPAIGVTAGVWVQINEVVAQGEQVYLLNTANLYVSGTREVAIPVNLLKAGKHYLLRLRAYGMAALDYRKAPMKRSLPYAFADVVTAVFTP